MAIDKIIQTTSHRPWKLSDKHWSYYQEWNNVIFLHWKVDLDELKKYVPKSLEIDLFNGDAWISLVAFTMEKIRPKNLPSFPPISNFNEINIRTYVKDNNKSGVYFLSIEGGNKASCLIARKLSELPYRFSSMSRSENSFTSRNKEFSDVFSIHFKTDGKLKDKSELDLWLTERYALYQDAQNNMNKFEIHHLEWPMFKIEFSELKIEYPRFAKLLTESPDLVHYSIGVQVIAWNKEKIS